MDQNVAQSVARASAEVCVIQKADDAFVLPDWPENIANGVMKNLFAATFCEE